MADRTYPLRTIQLSISNGVTSWFLVWN